MAKQREEKGLPANLDAERYVLGSILLDPANYDRASDLITHNDFSIEKHRRIFLRMGEIHRRGDRIDRVSLYNELLNQGQAESCDGLAYIVSLDDGLPVLHNLETYIRIVRGHSAKRKLIFLGQKIANMGMEPTLEAEEIVTFTTTSLNELDSLLNVDGAILSPEEHLRTVSVEDFLNPAKSSPGVPTGFKRLDDIINGLHPGRVYVIGADTNIGKSAFGVNVAYNVTCKGYPCVYFTLEMSREDLIHRMLCAHSEVPLSKLKKGTLSELDRYRLQTSLAEIVELPVYIDESSNITLSDFLSRTSRMIRDKKVQVAILDYLQIMDWQTMGKGTVRFRDEREALTYITRSMKMFAKRLNIPIVLLSQLSRLRSRRPDKEQRPKMSDLHGSGSIEKDSDVVIFIHRKEYDKPDAAELRGKAELIIAKNRHGPRGSIPMTFQGAFVRFKEVEESD